MSELNTPWRNKPSEPKKSEAERRLEEARGLFEMLLETAEIEEWKCYTGDLVYDSKSPRINVVIHTLREVLKG